jgi:hypothetical protein
MSRRLNKEEAAVDTGILDISLSLSGKLLAKIGRMLIFDILDDWVPASEV